MWPFGSSDDDDTAACGAHHMTKDFDMPETKILVDMGTALVKTKTRYECEHKGCSEYEYKWRTVGKLTEPEELDRLEDVLGVNL